jgi:hypothetical protein
MKIVKSTVEVRPPIDGSHGQFVLGIDGGFVIAGRAHALEISAKAC